MILIVNKMKIVDCFCFYNELDLLNYRFTILDRIVDYFVLVESTHTYAGKQKDLIYQNNKDMFQQFNHKIIHIVVDDLPYKYPNINYDNGYEGNQWHNERYQRNCIERGIKQLSLVYEDIIIISDLDELPDPNTLNRVKNEEISIISNSLSMDMYYYNLNSKKGYKWNASKILLYGLFKLILDNNLTCSDIRLNEIKALTNYTYSIPNGGWHLSYFGDVHFIKNKLEQFSHQEYNTNEYTNIENIQHRISNNLDLFERPNENTISISISENTYLPPQYEKLQKFILY